MTVDISTYEKRRIAAGRSKTSFWSHPGPEGGRTQFRFVISEGLEKHHKLLELGCANLRAGIHFIDYLNDWNYYGMDMNDQFLRSGRNLLKLFDLGDRSYTLLCNKDFEFYRFGVSFDFAFAHSVFTHLQLDDIYRCLTKMKVVLKKDGMFYSTFFQSRSASHERTRGCFRYPFTEIQRISRNAGLSVMFIGDVGFENRNQMMLKFVRG